MPPSLPENNADPTQAYANLSLEALRKAVQIYLTIAYGGNEPSAAVKKRLDWKDEGTAFTVLSQPPFEMVGKGGTDGAPIFALRLGNAKYPHMKIQIQPWTGPAGFLLSVNTHDQVLALDPKSPDAAAFRSLQVENQKLKQAIEQSWDEAGLPIFLRFLRDYLKSNPTGV